MTIVEAFILGLIQGITEFLPISSSGHLKLAEMLLGLSDLKQYVTFDLVCHAGTLFAIFLVFYKDLILAFTKDRQTFWMVFIATLPLGPLYFILSGIKSVYGQLNYLGFFFLLTSLFLYLGERFARTEEAFVSKKKRYLQAMFIGCAQAVAILPAVSRSGSTMAAARFLGWEREKAARFSFLLAVPTIIGGIAVESLEILKGKTIALNLSFSCYFVGFIVSFFVGWLVLKLLLNLLKHVTLKPFACYCFLLGIATIIFINILDFG